MGTKKKLLALVIASATYAGSVSAVTVDGIIDPDGEYSAGTTVSLGFAADGNGGSSGSIEGTFRFVIEGDYIFAALSAPTDFTDNVYSPDEAKTTAAGYGKKRTFDKLLGSDRLLFGLDLNDDGTSDMSVVIDYLALDTTPGIKDFNYDKLDLKGSDKGSALSQSINGKDNTYIQGAEDDTQNEYRAVFGETALSGETTAPGVILDVATSLEYNLSTTGCDDTTDSPDFSGSLPDGCSVILTYEWKMLASAFTDFSLSSIMAPLMHSSPSKIDKGSIFEPDCITTGNCPGEGVPEPGSLAVMLAGLLGLSWARRRRKAARLT